jgi:hypothetical protein
VGDAATGYVTYGLVNSAGYPYALEISGDQMRTWRPIDHAIVAAGQSVEGFAVWIESGQGNLLAAADDVTDSSTTATPHQYLWVSVDGGAHWREINSPGTSAYDHYVVQQHTADQPANRPLEICVELYSAGTSGSTLPQPTGIACSANGGDAWQALPLPPAPSCVASPSPTASGPRLQAIAANGDLLMDDDGCSDKLYRLPGGSATWQVVATAPQPDVTLTYYPAAGVVWTMPRISDPYTQVDPTGSVYTRSLAG